MPVTILGCRVDTIGADEAVRRIVDLARGWTTAPPHNASLVVTLGTEMVVRARGDAAFRRVINASALSLCDTVGVLFAARLWGARIPERVAGVDLIEPLCVALARDGLTVYFLGSKGDTAARAAAAVQKRVPGLRVAGARDGYFAPDDDALVAAEIAKSGARVVFVGLGSPRQEFWLARRLPETTCAVGIGVGGSFDVLAGNVERAPEMWRRLNLEWLYRLIREPARWRRQLALPHFVLLALRERLRMGPRPEIS
ncbi:MAG: WecB/TagA/CpsF family glycosyltransferase [Vulcanimicrobiaceae bacterium]